METYYVQGYGKNTETAEACALKTPKRGKETGKEGRHGLRRNFRGQRM